MVAVGKSLPVKQNTKGSAVYLFVFFLAYLAQAVMVRATALKADSASCIKEEIRGCLASYAQQA